MGKTRRGDKERSREQELKHENQRLRREISSLRKQLARIDLDRYSHIKDMVEEHLAQEEKMSTQEMLKSMKEEWKCRECNSGYLEIFLYNKIGETWYFRRCNSPDCEHRTKSQPYTPSVKGIMKEPVIPDKNNRPKRK